MAYDGEIDALAFDDIDLDGVSVQPTAGLAMPEMGASCCCCVNLSSSSTCCSCCA